MSKSLITQILFLSVFGVLAFQCKGHLVIPQDISPNAENGSSEACVSKAGVICELAGTEKLFYAVSLNAGVWKSKNGGEWVQLQSSPRYASVIAVDPSNPAHTVVGEHAGEAAKPELNRTGVWESFDEGESWRLIFNPITRSADIRDQSIDDVAFTPSGTLLIGTCFGVGRKKVCPGSSIDCFDFSSSPKGVAEISAFTFSRGAQANAPLIVWALGSTVARGNPDRIVLSEDDGLTWDTSAIPRNVDGYDVGFARGDKYSLAAYGELAIVSFKPTNAEQAQYSWDPDKWSNNWVALLYYSKPLKGYFVQALKENPYWGDGRGLGGRSRLQVFSKDNSYEPVVGTGLSIFYAFGQDVLTANGLGGRGELSWTPIGRTCCGGCEQVDNPKYLTNHYDVHADLWDVHLNTPDGTLRLATDGGIFKRIKNEKGKWEYVSHNSGLHTQHIHSVVALPSLTTSTTVPQLAYTTMDNNAWYRDRVSGGMWIGWQSCSDYGDADFAMGDQAVNNIALLGGRGDLMYTDFGHGKPIGATKEPGVRFTHNIGTPGLVGDSLHTLNLQVVQTLKNESPKPLLDVVLLVQTTIKRRYTLGVETIITSKTGGPILIRNSQFLAHPDAVQPYYDGWSVVSNTLPVGTQAIWVSNGHTNPVFYVETAGPSNEIYRMNYTEGMDWNATIWHKLGGIDGGIGAKILNTPNKFWGGLIGIGPLFVNPYDPDQIFVLTDKGVMRPPSTGTITETTVFKLDEVLTALLTQSGTYDVGACFGGGDRSGTYLDQRATARYVIAQMAFNRENPHHVLAASPASGLFVIMDKTSWLSLTEYLPQPFTMISSVAIEGQTAYAALEGRGLWRFLNYQGAKMACYFKKAPASDPTAVASLYTSDTKPVPDAPVVLRVVDKGVEIVSTIDTDHNGAIRAGIAKGKVIHLHYAGDADNSPCDVSLVR